jgi:hypothetical protein
VEQADVDEGGGEETPPLAGEDEIRVGGSEVEELRDGGVFGGDAAEDHPEEDGAVDADEEVGGRSGEDAAGARMLYGFGRRVIRGELGLRVFAGAEDFAFRLIRGRHGCSFYAIAGRGGLQMRYEESEGRGS